MTRFTMVATAGLLLFAGVPLKAAAQELAIKLSFERGDYRQGESVSVKYTVTNTGSRTVAVLKWNTPLEGMVGDPFVVLHDGAQRAYRGVMVLRSNPVASDWALIPPKHAVSASVDLAPAYDLSAAGDYQVRARFGFQHVAFDAIPDIELKALRRRNVQSNSATFRMLDSGQSPGGAIQKPGGPAVRFVGCDTGQTSALTTAYNAMYAEATKVTSSVGGWAGCPNWTNNQPAQTFLGTCTAAALMRAKAVTSTVSSDGPSAALDCTGTNTCYGSRSNCLEDNVLAFTCLYGANRTIYVCPGRFFGLPVKDNIDSQQTALYHELTHWAGVLDYAYGCKACADLAKNNSAQAQENASSYMYFAIFLSSGQQPSCGCSVARPGSAAPRSALPLLALVLGGYAIRRRSRSSHGRGLRVAARGAPRNAAVDRLNVGCGRGGG